MRLVTSLALPLLAIAFLVACDDNAESTETEGTAAVAAAVETESGSTEETAVADQPEADEAAPPCQPLSDRMKASARTVLEELSLEHDDLDGWWAGQTRSFLTSCEENLSDEQRNCLLEAEDPLAMAGLCGLPDMASNQRPRAPELSRIWLSDPADLSDDDSAAILSSMVGTWHNSWESANEEHTWTIADDGAVNVVFTRRDNTEESEQKITFRQENRLHMDNLQGSTQPRTFAKVDDDTFYASGNLLYDAHPFTDRSHFRLQNRQVAIVHDDGDCAVFSSTGARGNITCEFSREGEVEVFSVSYTLPTSLSRDGTPREHTGTYRIYDGFLVDANMQRFVRR